MSVKLEHQLELKKAVEEQLDLILKMEEQRKALKKQNKLLNLKIKSLVKTMQKYEKQTNDGFMNTDEMQEEAVAKPISAIMCEQQVQVQWQSSSLPLNFSKLTEAEMMLKALDYSQSKMEQSERKLEENIIAKANQRGSEKVEEGKASKKDPVLSSNKQVSMEIVKMSKEISCLRREVKQWEQKGKGKDKQIKDLKKCLENKSEALEKARKDFNQLSILMNSDKFKSVRLLEQQNSTLKHQLLQKEDNSNNKVRSMLEAVTEQYREYKKQMESRLDILVEELAAKQKENDEIRQSLRNMRRLDY